jgi:hypothetical protein
MRGVLPCFTFHRRGHDVVCDIGACRRHAVRIHKESSNIWEDTSRNKLDDLRQREYINIDRRK